MTIRSTRIGIAKVSFFTSLILGSLSNQVFAETEPEAVELNTISVIGSKVSKENKQQAVDLTIITAEDISKGTGSNLAEVLANVAGVNVRTFFGTKNTNATVDMGGFGAAAGNNTLVLLDGQRLNDIDLAAVDLSSIPLEFIERIEILPGSGSVLYGNGASGGSINIVTKAEYNKKAKVSLSTSTHAEPGQIAVSLAKNTENTSNLISFDATNGDGYRANSEYKQRNLLLNSKYYADESGILFTTLQFDEQEARLPGVRTVNPNPDADPATDDALNEISEDPRSTSTENDFSTQKGYRITSGYKIFTGEDQELNLVFGVRKKEQSSFFDDYSGFGYTSYRETELRTISATPYWKGVINTGSVKNNITLGADYYFSQYKSLRSLNQDTINQPNHIVAIEQSLNAIYLQNITQVTDQLSFTAGLRREIVKTEGLDDYDATAPDVPFATDTQADPLSATEKENSYIAGVRYQFNDHWATYARQESSVRFGTVDEIYENRFDQFFNQSRLFDQLEPQTGSSNEIGIDYTSENFKARLSGYETKFENEIHFDPSIFQNINLDDTKRTGARLKLSYKPVERVKINLNSTYTKATFEEGANEGKTVPIVPRQQHNLSALWELNQNIFVTATTRYIGRKYLDNDQTNEATQIPEQKTTDLKVAWDKNAVSAYLAVYNIADEEGRFDYGTRSTSNPEIYNGYTLPGRTGELGISYTY